MLRVLAQPHGWAGARSSQLHQTEENTMAKKPKTSNITTRPCGCTSVNGLPTNICQTHLRKLG